MRKIVLCLTLLCRMPLLAQGTTDRTAAQREAMARLSFLAGNWSGPATIRRGSGPPLQATQTEEVQYKLDGLVLLIEGTSRDAAGKVLFRALATIAYDETTKTYRFRAFNDGHYLDTELAVSPNGFSWSYDAGPAHIVNTMHVSDKANGQRPRRPAWAAGRPDHRLNYCCNIFPSLAASRMCWPLKIWKPASEVDLQWWNDRQR